MRTLNKLLFVISIVLVAASTIQTRNLDFEQAVRVLMSPKTQITLGKGNAPNDLPIAECIKSQDLTQLNCTVSLRLTDRSNDHCKIVLSTRSSGVSPKLNAVYQLSEKKLIVIWGQLSREDNELLVRKITTIDFENCANTVTLDFSKYIKKQLEDVILYDDGFDVLALGEYSNKLIIRYDLNGHELESFPYDKDPLKYQRTIKDIKDVITFEKVKSEYKKQLIINARSSQFLTVCGQKSENDPEKFECTQTDVPNSLKHKMEVILPKNVKLISVYDFKEGGVALFGIRGNNEIVVAEIRPIQQPQLQNYNLKWSVNSEMSIILSFNEKTSSFAFAAEINESDHSVVLQHFDLPSKIDQRLKNRIEY